MKKLKHTLLGILVLFGCTNLSATKAHEKNYQTYENGFGVTVSSYLPISASYLLGKDNNWGPYFGIAPYTKTENLNGIAAHDTYLTKIGAGLFYFQPIARGLTKNKLFLANAAHWNQKFGQANFNAKIKSSWALIWTIGLEYRFTPNFYLGMGAPVIGYSQTRYETPNTTVFATDTTQKVWKILSRSAVSITFKI